MQKRDLNPFTKLLFDSRLDFVPRGKVHIEAVVALVKARYPEWCDDGYLCAYHCINGPNRPEWRHKVEQTLQRLKTTAPDRVTKHPDRGWWEFR